MKTVFIKVCGCVLGLSLFVLLTVFAPQGVKADAINDLIPTICMAESSNNPLAYNKEGSYGLMGISPCVVREYANYLRLTCADNPPCKQCNKYEKDFNLYDPEVNKMLGTWYLHKLQSQLPLQYKESRAHLVANYNFGFSKFKSMGFKIPKKHKNKIYNAVYQEYWKHLEVSK